MIINVIINDIQLYDLGFHIGHILKLSKFFARWMLSFSALSVVLGSKLTEMFFELFIINLSLTALGLKSLFAIGKGLGLANKRTWFICNNRYFSLITARYAITAGAGYSIYE
jgi:hypothetical protein